MKVQIEDISKLEKKIRFEIEKEEVKKKMDEAYLELKNSVRIKGFRVGKVPIHIIQKLFKKEVEGKVSQTLVSENIYKTLEDNKLEPIGYPKINMDPLEIDKNFTFSIEFDVRPSVELKNHKDFEIEVEENKVTEESILAQLTKLQQENTVYTPITDRDTVSESDVVLFSYQGFVDDTPFKAVKGESVQLRLGKDRFILDLEKEFPGMKIGEMKAVSIESPEKFDEALKDKKFSVQLTVKEIKKEVVPELNDDFAKDLEFDGLDRLKEKIRANLLEMEKYEYERRANTILEDKLIELNPFEVPKSIINLHLESLVLDYKNRLTKSGIRDEAMVNHFVEEYRKNSAPVSERFIRIRFIFDAIIGAEKLEVSETELQAKIEEIARSVNQVVAKIRAKLGEEGIANITTRMLDEKVYKLVREAIRIKIVEPKPKAAEDAPVESQAPNTASEAEGVLSPDSTAEAVKAEDSNPKP